MKMPPIEKIPEAWSALADGRVRMGEQSALVASSDGKRTYTVRWSGNEYASDDSATYWQGYPGYPVLAVLMKQGRLPVEEEMAAHFASIDWHGLNERHRRKYAEALDEVLKGKPWEEEARRQMRETYQALERLPLIIRRKLSLGNRPGIC